jgi:LPS O-antigen subunit length determinant protein (WzzB/FepE family)
MRNIARFLIHLYPASWRQRYGEEFQALLEDSAPSLSTFVDLMAGGIKMRLTTPSFPKLALILSLSGLLAAWGISYLVTPTYISSAVLQITPEHFDNSVSNTILKQALAQRLGQMQQEILSRTSLSAIITDPGLDLYQPERASQPLEDVIQAMLHRDIRIVTSSPPGERRAAAFMISFTYRDRIKAQHTVQALIARLQEANLNYAAADQLKLTYGGFNLDVLDPPSLPVAPARPNRYMIAFYGFGAGFLLALLTAIFLRRRVRPAISFPAQPA